MPTHVKMELAQLSAVERGDDDGMSSISVFWDSVDHPVGLWVKYSQSISHKQAFSVLAEGLWKALQDPEKFDVSVDSPAADKNGNPAPYAVLTDDDIVE